MENVIRKEICKFCKYTNRNNCMKIIFSKNNDVLTYKCENFISKGETKMDKEEMEKFRKRHCEKCKEKYCDGLTDNGLEIVCKYKNLHMTKSFEKTQQIKKTR